jgi:hypothetical protein
VQTPVTGKQYRIMNCEITTKTDIWSSVSKHYNYRGAVNTLRTGDADLRLYAYKQFKYLVPNVLSPQPDQEENKLQGQKILIFIYPIYNHNWRNISTIYIYKKTSIKRYILTIKQNTLGSTSD